METSRTVCPLILVAACFVASCTRSGLEIRESAQSDNQLVWYPGFPERESIWLPSYGDDPGVREEFARLAAFAEGLEENERQAFLYGIQCMMIEPGPGAEGVLQASFPIRYRIVGEDGHTVLARLDLWYHIRTFRRHRSDGDIPYVLWAESKVREIISREPVSFVKHEETLGSKSCSLATMFRYGGGGSFVVRLEVSGLRRNAGFALVRPGGLVRIRSATGAKIMPPWKTQQEDTWIPVRLRTELPIPLADGFRQSPIEADNLPSHDIERTKAIAGELQRAVESIPRDRD